MEKQLYTLGIDIGSTTVKIAILDEAKQLIFSDYRRHFANIRETLRDLFKEAYALSLIHIFHTKEAACLFFDLILVTDYTECPCLQHGCHLGGKSVDIR